MDEVWRGKIREKGERRKLERDMDMFALIVTHTTTRI